MEDKQHLQLQKVSYFADQGQNKHSEDKKNPSAMTRRSLASSVSKY